MTTKRCPCGGEAYVDSFDWPTKPRQWFLRCEVCRGMSDAVGTADAAEKLEIRPDQGAEKPMEIQGQPGELRATIHVTRAATGLVETYELVGHSDPEKLAEIVAQARRNRVHGASGSLTGPGSGVNVQSQE